MKFGLMSLDYKHLPLENCFQLANAYGFDGLEIFGSRLHLYPDDLTPEKTKAIIAYKEKYNINIPMYTPNALNLPVCICSTLSRERADGVAYYKKSVDVAAAIGAERLLVVADHPGFLAKHEEVWGYLVTSMEEICTHAEGSGVQVTIEPLTPLESPMITTVDDCLALLHDVNKSNLFAMLDVVPPVVVHEPISKYFELLGEKLDYIHICNTDGRTDAHLLLDNGILNIRDILQVFQNQHYTGYVTAELYSEIYRDPEMLVSNTASILRRIRDELNL